MILFIHFVTLKSMETLEFQKSGIVKCNLCAYEIELAWCQKKTICSRVTSYIMQNA
jgi:hypothetical protein